MEKENPYIVAWILGDGGRPPKLALMRAEQEDGDAFLAVEVSGSNPPSLRRKGGKKRVKRIKKSEIIAIPQFLDKKNQKNLDRDLGFLSL